jgi:hypothetical protein
MPESRLRRRKAAFTPPPGKSAAPKPNARWYAPTMVVFLLSGLVWVVTYYLTDGRFPVPSVGNYNLLVGFGVVLVGFGMLTRWR